MNPPLGPYPPSPVEVLPADLFEDHHIRVFIKRDDLLQPTGDQQFCGNKVRKLKYNLQAAREAGKHSLLTFGGAFSNHIAAVASAGRAYGFNTVGVIRGEAHEPLNPTLARASQDGMELHYLDRSLYRQKHTAEVEEKLRQKFGDFFLIPEGGTNDAALMGCGEIIREVEDQLASFPDYIALACGTGGTMAGLIRAGAGRAHILGISALKGDFMSGQVRKLLSRGRGGNNWSVREDYHFGGYAKFPDELRRFTRGFERDFGILLDPVYTAKMAFGITDLIRRGFFARGSDLLLIHTGGLQGWAGF